MAEQNDLEQWIAECCARDPKGEAGATKLYESFQQWKERNGEHAPAMRNFSQRLERMFDKKHTKAGRVFMGLTLSPSGGDYLAASRMPSGISFHLPSLPFHSTAGLVIRWPTLRTNMSERPCSDTSRLPLAAV